MAGVSRYVIRLPSAAGCRRTGSSPGTERWWLLREALLRQLSLLDREVERVFTYPEELALARVADAQGLGGHSEKVTQ